MNAPITKFRNPIREKPIEVAKEKSKFGRAEKKKKNKTTNLAQPLAAMQWLEFSKPKKASKRC